MKRAIVVLYRVCVVVLLVACVWQLRRIEAMATATHEVESKNLLTAHNALSDELANVRRDVHWLESMAVAWLVERGQDAFLIKFADWRERQGYPMSED